MTLLKRNNGLLNDWPTTRFFDDFFSRDFFNWGLGNNSQTNTNIPAVNIKETADHYLVELAAPGMEKKDFKIELEGNLLKIVSEKKEEQEFNDNGQSGFSHKEFSYQSFQRIISLPKDVVDAEKINARYENGILSMQIPKKEEAKKKAPRLIQIS